MEVFSGTNWVIFVLAFEPTSVLFSLLELYCVCPPPPELALIVNSVVLEGHK